MSVQVENLEKNMVKLTIEVPAEELEKAIDAAYKKQKNQISIPGFRKGKVPRAMVEKMYGVEVFYEDAANTLMQQNYPSAVEESGVDIVSRPSIDVVQIEKGKPFIYTAEVAVRPEVTLGKYMGVTVTKIDTSVSDDEVAEALEQQRNNNARTISVTDRPVAVGDTAVIDFEGFVDGVAFEGGKGENHPLEIGSHTFIDNFEDQLVGKNAGDEVEVNVTFPELYQAADLAGKPATFKVKINEIKAKELPELDDEFAQDVSEFDTLAEYKESLKKNLEEKKENEAKRSDILYLEGMEGLHKIPQDEVLSREFGGTDISGGQWQRIAIARARYRDGEVYLLDEPTSAIDPNEERTFYELFMQMMEGKTSFLVTHRMGAARLAEKIIVMQGGRICDFGTHEQLYGTCEEYQKLWDAQADAY